MRQRDWGVVGPSGEVPARGRCGGRGGEEEDKENGKEKGRIKG